MVLPWEEHLRDLGFNMHVHTFSLGKGRKARKQNGSGNFPGFSLCDTKFPAGEYANDGGILIRGELCAISELIYGVSAITLYLLCSSSVPTLWFIVAHYKSSVWKFQSHHWSLLQQHSTDKQLMERKVLLLHCSLLPAYLSLQLQHFSDSIGYWIFEKSFSGYKVRHYFVICTSDTERTLLFYCKLPTAATKRTMFFAYKCINFLFGFWILIG